MDSLMGQQVPALQWIALSMLHAAIMAADCWNSRNIEPLLFQHLVCRIYLL
ncbi:MAG: hypothetical protein IKP58_17205 [Victivallales bacterium]|nr:hypothetical protein [Victivallales bacterium]